MNNTVKNYEKLSEQYNKMLEERNSIIDDLSWYKAKANRLEREIEDREKSHIELYCDKKALHDENKALRLQANTYFDEWQGVKKQYTTLTNHIRMKAEMNPGVSRYIDLVNYIDRLEQK